MKEGGVQPPDGIEHSRSVTAVAGLAAQLRAVSRSLAVAIFLLAGKDVEK